MNLDELSIGVFVLLMNCCRGFLVSRLRQHGLEPTLPESEVIKVEVIVMYLG